MLNTLLAFAVAPFLALLVTAPLAALATGQLDAWGLLFGFGLLVVYASVVLVALPLYAVVARFLAPVKRWHCVAGGLISALPLPIMSFDGSLENVALALVTGALSGVIFWYVRRALDVESLKRASLTRVP